MEQIASTQSLAQVIQLAVAPVFLLAGIAGLLGVLSTRLGRIIDRARVIERRVPRAKREEQRQLLNAETASLWQRIDLINWAIRLCVTAALLICLVIVTLFVGALLRPQDFNVAILIASLFVLAMLLLIAGLVFLLREIHAATRQMRAGVESALHDAPDSDSRA
jgi:hypothetical protein